jgi:hypothetical protein
MLIISKTILPETLKIRNKISNKIAVDSKTGESKADKDISKLNKQKYKVDDVVDSIPDSANSVLF